MKRNFMIINALLILIQNFTFIYPDVNPDLLTINRITNYTFSVQRNIDINLNPTNALT
jgi:hypothetical protein